MKRALFSLLLLFQTLYATTPPKMILVFTEMVHCPWCHKMRRETIDEPSALKEIQKYYIITKITRESGDIPLFLHPKYYPTTYILSWDGSRIIEELPGYMPKGHFLEYLEELYEVENSEG